MNYLEKIFIPLAFWLFVQSAFCNQPAIIYNQKSNVQVNNPEVSKIFYDNLSGSPRDFIINSAKDFDLYIKIRVPYNNFTGRYSAQIISTQSSQAVASLDGQAAQWTQYFDPIGRDFYWSGPEFEKSLPAGEYKIEVSSLHQNGEDSSPDNKGKYALMIGKQNKFTFAGFISNYWILPTLKLQFFQTSVVGFLWTPFGWVIFALIILILLMCALFILIRSFMLNARIKKTRIMILASTGAHFKEQILKIADKPLYDITIAFITTASKVEQDKSYVEQDRQFLRETGFNVEEIDIEGMSYGKLFNLLESKDVICVEGGNTYYFLKHAKACRFGKVVQKLLDKGVIYFGISAGAIIMGRTIETAGWKNGDKNIIKLKDLRGFGLVDFNLFVHYLPEHAEEIKQKLARSKYPLRALNDDQAFLIMGKDVILLGDQPEVKFTKVKNEVIQEENNEDNNQSQTEFKIQQNRKN